MASKYFNVELSPTVAASVQHAGVFATNSVLFDWQAIQVPKGANAITSAVVMMRAKGDSTPTPNHAKVDVLFSKTNTVSLGTVRAQPDHRPSNDFLGHLIFEAGSYSLAGVSSTSIATLGANESRIPLVLTGSNEGVDVVYDTIYVGITAGEEIDFQSILVVSDADIASAAHTTIVTAGSSIDNREILLAGDVVHAQDDAVVGTLDSVAESAITLTSELGTSVLTNGDTLYNISPIKLILGFELGR